MQISTQFSLFDGLTINKRSLLAACQQAIVNQTDDPLDLRPVQRLLDTAKQLRHCIHSEKRPHPIRTSGLGRHGIHRSKPQRLETRNQRRIAPPA
jgi:hypothetical protein